MHITAVHLVRIISWKAGSPLSSSLLWLRVSCWQAMQAAGLQRTRPRDTAVTALWWCSRWCSHLTLLSQPPLRTACSFEYPGRALPTVSLTKSGTNLLPYVQVGLGTLFLGNFFIALDVVLERPPISWTVFASPKSRWEQTTNLVSLLSQRSGKTPS